MPKFCAKSSYTIESRSLFVLAGSVVEGEIRCGMQVHLPFNSGLKMTADIDCIEFARRLGGQEDTCLCIRYSSPEELMILRSLDIGGETFEVTTPESN